ncbi:ribosome silencing factor [Pigmentibacter ruber]|uniref:ribosome silencing factor n=1 Tax=Pigmentibacter ruber TaxID=2683196 RepID=UPI00131D3A53|nr:ribosome silencing factor [Pigmentibacter ruber]
MNEQKTAIKIGDRELSHEEIAKLAVAVATEKKAVRPTILDLRNLGAFTELFTIVSAANSRQVYAIADSIKQFFKHSLGLPPISVDGLESSTWVLIDYGFLFIHVFQEPTREMYQLEQLWNKAHSINVNEEEVQTLYQDIVKISQEIKSASELEQNSSNLF